uniref:Geranylgeranyl transferase type-2 subunit alpha n=1 Tax=Parastrongyloides trichosuri TaxID=131310 RepID=A0A0N4ZIG3_PARTI
MHFIKKVPTTEEQHEVQEREKRAKATAYQKLIEAINKKLKDEIYDEELMKLSAQVLSKNPDAYTLWNVRKKYIDKKISEQDDADKNDAILEDELYLALTSLTKNPKSYSAWFHRFWAFKKMMKPNVKQELEMCRMALQLDCRNFHCWDHRRSVADYLNLKPVEELEFVDYLIEKNISNYSAWHYRATLLERLHGKDVENQKDVKIDEDTLLKEFDLVSNAYYTDSEDQACWCYVKWLIDSSVRNMTPKIEKQINTVIQHIKELYELEPNNIYLLSTHIYILEKTSGDKEEIVSMYKNLAEIDKMRKGMYLDKAAKYSK